MADGGWQKQLHSARIITQSLDAICHPPSAIHVTFVISAR